MTEIWDPREAKSDFLHLQIAVLFILMLMATVMLAVTGQRAAVYLATSVDGEEIPASTVSVKQGKYSSTFEYTFVTPDGKKRTGKYDLDSAIYMAKWTKGDKLPISYSAITGLHVPSAFLGHHKLEFYLTLVSIFTVIGGAILIVRGGFKVREYSNEKRWY